MSLLYINLLSVLNKIKTFNRYKILYFIVFAFACLVLLVHQVIVQGALKKTEYKKPLILADGNLSSTVTVYLGEGFVEPGFYVFENGTKVLDVLSSIDNSVELNQNINSSRVLLEGDVLSFSNPTLELNKKSIAQADYDTLTKVPGVGDARAKNILDYIHKNSISSVDELDKIPGIGDKIINDLKEYFY